MQSRRREDYTTQSPSSKLRNQHRIELGHESYAIPRRETVDRSPHRHRRSLSPRSKVEGSRRVLLREGRNSSTERREYGWHLGASRTENVHSDLPSYLQDHKKPQFDEEVVYRRDQYVGGIDYNDGKRNRLKRVYEYHHHGASSRMSKEKDYDENRIVGVDGHEMMGKKSVPLEDVMIRRSYRDHPDLVPASNYGETGRHLPLSSRSMDTDHFEPEQFQYREPVLTDKMPVRELYKQGEKPVFRSADVSYSMLPTSYSKDYGNTSQFKVFAGTSSGGSRSEFSSSYTEGMSLPASDKYPRSSVTEPMDFNTHAQRSFIDIRDHEPSKRSIASYPLHAYSPNRVGCDDYHYQKSQGNVNDDHLYPSNDLHRTMHPHSWSDNEHTPTDYKHAESSRSSIMHPVVDATVHNEDSYKSMQKSPVWDHPTIQKQAATENLDISRILYASKHGGEYLDSGYTQVEFQRRESRDNEASHLGVTRDHQIPHQRSDYQFGRDASPHFQNETLRDPRISIYDLEMETLEIKRQRMEEELSLYKPSGKLLKRKYNAEEDTDSYDRRTILSSKWNAPQEFDDLYISAEEWIDEDMNALHVSRNRRFDHNGYKKLKSIYDGHHSGDFESEGWSSRDSLAHVRRHSTRNYKSNVKYAKGHPRSGRLSGYNSHKNEGTAIHGHKFWKRDHDYDEDTQANDNDPSEDWVNLPEDEPSEDSEEFRQLVDEAFLAYSKRLNLTSAVQGRYKAEGKAGSLFCIVCGRSSSKEFMDTRRLVTHAFMSHKVGLRAKHLGLHKAICVLMGWNSCAPSETITWVPEILPDAEALAQKEDLILWPPLVIIHNISMSNNNPEQQKVVPIEGVEAFLRGKGFVGGKIKVCLGKPADQSVMLVKFLGTFTGLGIAERLDKYFAENKHGREEFVRKTSNNSKSSNYWEAEMQGKLEEHLLYGYTGIAEDLDRLDFNTKKWIVLKSKKEIQDLANAPVKTDDR